MKTKQKQIDVVPRHELSLVDEMDRAFDTLMGGWMRPFRGMFPEWARAEGLVETPVPRIEAIDRDEEILVRAELPGVDKKDLDLTLTGQVLTLRGERKREEHEEKGDYIRSEIAFGGFSRSIRLPHDVDIEHAKAEFKNGVLEVHLPKLKKTVHRQINVA